MKTSTNKKILPTVLSVILLFELFSLYVSGASYNEYYYKRNSDNKIALTFDDGPHPVYTKKILDVLSKYDIKATFFIVGENARYYKNTLLDIVKHGHELGNHTFSHTISREGTIIDLTKELEECRNTIYEICGENTVLFRPPGGIITEMTANDAEIYESYDVILWSVDTNDWKHLSPEQIADCVLENVRSGDIILMHDFIGKDSPTPEALEIIIPKLIDKGYKFVTVGELISSE